MSTLTERIYAAWKVQNGSTARSPVAGLSQDEQRGMEWWNALPEDVRLFWLRAAMSAVPADAWRAYKASWGGAVPQGGMGGVPPMLTRSKPAGDSLRGQGVGLSGPGSRPEKPAVR